MEIFINGNNNIQNSAIGENNTVIVEAGIVDWDKLTNEWLLLLTHLPIDAEEYKYSSKALKNILNKDKEGLFTYIKKHIPSFISELFINTASPFIVDFIRKII